MGLSRVSQSVLLPYAIQDVYQLVADVDSYHKFLPWVKQSQVTEQSDESIIGFIDVRVAGFSETLVTKNQLRPFKQIDLEFLEGPFSQFTGAWRFSDLKFGCKATLELNFEFKPRLLRLFTSKVMDKIIDHVMKAFIERARSILKECE